MPSISQRSANVPLSPFRKLVPFADAAKRNGTHVYHLNIGQPDIHSPSAAWDALRKHQGKILAYTPAIGNLSYRQKLATYYDQYQMRVKPQDIIVTTGASEAIQFLLFATLNPGDEMIIPEPFYANYNGFCSMAGVTIQPVTSRIEDGFPLPSITEFEQKINARTKAIFITNPSNPTGSFYRKEDLEALRQLVIAHDLFLFVDEVYREFCYDDNTFYSSLSLEGVDDHVVVIDSVSKRYSACGARIGALVTRNPNLKEAITRYAKVRISAPGLGQLFAEAILDQEEGYLTAVKEEYDRRRMLVYNRLKAMPGVVNYKPGGAFYCFAKFPVESAEHFCRWLLESFNYRGSTVMLSPGTGFYASADRGTDEVRIAYVLCLDDLEKAMDCLEKALAAYPGKALVDTRNQMIDLQE
ncbi:MAG: pyridoxal phosphate-dependent aminotransferase [Saprospiraceae bacterium]|nr:pyridoxal phosphate-dependent aminotransferase [Saprospiraceae bacterium]